MSKIPRKKLIYENKNSILHEDYHVFYCKETDKFSTRKKSTKEPKVPKKENVDSKEDPKVIQPKPEKNLEVSLKQLKNQFRQ
jgi:hypothetical protein